MRIIWLPRSKTWGGMLARSIAAIVSTLLFEWAVDKNNFRWRNIDRMATCRAGGISYSICPPRNQINRMVSSNDPTQNTCRQCQKHCRCSLRWSIIVTLTKDSGFHISASWSSQEYIVLTIFSTHEWFLFLGLSFHLVDFINPANYSSFIRHSSRHKHSSSQSCFCSLR